MALRYWKEPFDVFQRDMKWIWERKQDQVPQQLGMMNGISGVDIGHQRNEPSHTEEEDASYLNGMMLAVSKASSESMVEQQNLANNFSNDHQDHHHRITSRKAVAAGELTSLGNVRTLVDERLIYRGSDGHLFSQQHPRGPPPQSQHPNDTHKYLHPSASSHHHSSVSPIVHRNSGVTAHSDLLSASSLGRHLDAVVASTPHPNAHNGHVSFAATTIDDDQEPSSGSSSASANAHTWAHRNVTPREYRQTQIIREMHDATPETPPSKRSLFIETASSNKTTHFETNSAVLHYETIGTQTTTRGVTHANVQADLQPAAVSDSGGTSSPREVRRWQLESERKDSLIVNLQKELHKAREYTQKLEMEHAEQLESVVTQSKNPEVDGSSMIHNEVVKLRKQVQELQDERSSLTQSISTLQNQSVDASEVESLHRKIRRLQAERDDAEDLSQILKRKVSNLENALESVSQSSVMMSRIDQQSFAGSQRFEQSVAEQAPSILTQNEIVALSSLVVELYLCVDSEGIEEQVKEMVQQLIDQKIVENAIRCQLAGDRCMFSDPENAEHLLFESPCVLQGVCTVLLKNTSNKPLPVLWSIAEEATIKIELIEDESPLELEYPSLKTFIFQLACDLGKEPYGEKWLQVLQNTFEVASTLDLLDFTSDQWSELPKYIPHGTVLKMQENVYRLDICNRTEPSESDLQSNIHLYMLKVKQYFHYMAADVKNVQLLDKNAVNIGVRELSKKYYCKRELKEVNAHFLKVIGSETVNLLDSFKSVLLHGPKGAAQNNLVKLLPPLVGFTRLSDWDIVHHDQSKLRVRAEAKGLEFFPCALCINDFHEFPQNIQLDVLNVVDQLRNVILFISSESIHSISSMILKRISFQVHVGSLDVRDRWKFVRRIATESGIQIEDNNQRNMLLSVTANYTYESMKNLVEWLPVLANERAITSWTPDVVTPCATRIAKQFCIQFGQYSVPRCFREWSRMQLPAFVSPIQESQKYRGLFLIHTGRHPIQARFHLLTSLSQEDIRPTLTAESHFKKSNALVESQLLPSRVQSNTQLYESLMSVVVQFGISEQVDYFAMIDARSCIEECGSLQDEGKIIEHIEHVIAECQQYARALLLFDMDGLTSTGQSLWNYITYTCSSRALHNHVDKKNHHAQTAAFWIGCITKHDKSNLALEETLHFPRNEASFKYEIERLEKSKIENTSGRAAETPKSQVCKTCGHEYLLSEHEICCFHSGDLVEIDRATGEANPTDKRTALLQDFIFKERSNILIWTCCYNTVHHEGCKKMQHSATMDKKKLFVDEAQDNFEMIRVNPILLRQAFSRPKTEGQ